MFHYTQSNNSYAFEFCVVKHIISTSKAKDEQKKQGKQRLGELNAHRSWHKPYAAFRLENTGINTKIIAHAKLDELV